MNARLLLSIALLSLGAALPVLAANPRAGVTKSVGAIKPTTKPAVKAAKAVPAPSAVTVKTNPLLPPAIPVDSFLLDMSLVQKLPAVAPKEFEPIYTSADWEAYR